MPRDRNTFLGFPIATAGVLPTLSLAASVSARSSPSPVQNLDPHVAALGMRFYTGTMFPEAYRQQIFIAEHGSWNRTTPSGYRACWCGLTTIRRYRMNPLPPAGCTRAVLGDDLSMCW